MRIFVWTQNRTPIAPVDLVVLKHRIPKVASRSIDLFPSFGGVEEWWQLPLRISAMLL
jgi:hypothetical protein